MRAFHHPDQALHDPEVFMRFGRLVPAKDQPERTQRLLAALARRGVAVEAPEPVGLAPILRVHSPDYLRFLETLWPRWSALVEAGPVALPNTFPYWSGRPDWQSRPACPATGLTGQAGWYLGDLASAVGPHTWTSALRSAETAARAAEAVLAGENRVYALCRPSGHHARADRASGFCYLNNTAVAAQRLRQKFARVAILDVDAHHGDGTQQIFYLRDDVLTISLHADPADYYPFYTGYAGEIGQGAGGGCNLNLPLPHGSGAAAMRAALDQAVRRIASFGAQALVVALGFDAHRRDPLSVLAWDSEDFGAIGRSLRGLALPTLAVQEGGYALDVIGDCLEAFLAGWDEA